jgi:hypothetical protein
MRTLAIRLKLRWAESPWSGHALHWVRAGVRSLIARSHGQRAVLLLQPGTVFLHCSWARQRRGRTLPARFTSPQPAPVAGASGNTTCGQQGTVVIWTSQPFRSVTLSWSPGSPECARSSSGHLPGACRNPVAGSSLQKQTLWACLCLRTGQEGTAGAAMANSLGAFSYCWSGRRFARMHQDHQLTGQHLYRTMYSLQ